eukprot:TRINITY_DN7924_c0_g1_i1.p1 TRINITY_DN7924_c0_g1~~TRINITY_DN7924_c0_g1_i1.p1  ORF type:complete len:448 (-),score=149.75 TRINITY_DN7924_c0_g1_i1:365-1708(-)
MSEDNRVCRMTANDGLFPVHGFDHLEFTCCDALTTSRYLKHCFGLTYTAETCRTTHNYKYSSYVLQNNNIKFVVTAPYKSKIQFDEAEKHNQPNPTYDDEAATNFFTTHGNGISAVGVRVENLQEVYEIVKSKGGNCIIEPTVIKSQDGNGSVSFCEFRIYDDDDFEAIFDHMPDVYEDIEFFRSNTNMRFIEYKNFDGPFLPGYSPVVDPKPLDYGLQRVDHIVGNVYRMEKVCTDIKNWFGFHTFAFFTKEEIKTRWSSLNSEVLASDTANVLMPINESAPGKKESQILKYLRAYQGPGVQHVAIKTNNIFETLSQITNSPFEMDFLFVPDGYYEQPEIVERIDELTSQHKNPYGSQQEFKKELKKYHLLVDQDENGTLLQIFTKPLFDRPTLFIEIIQRICSGDDLPGCGRFGKGNFKSLFETLETYFEGKQPVKEDNSNNNDN